MNFLEESVLWRHAQLPLSLNARHAACVDSL